MSKKLLTNMFKPKFTVKSMVITAMLVAMHIALTFFGVWIDSSVRISIAFVTTCTIGAFYGPVIGFIAGAIGDVLGFIIKPTGPFFLGWTLNAALAGFIYGVMFYGKSPKVIEKTRDFNKYIIRSVSVVLSIFSAVCFAFLPKVVCLTEKGNIIDRAVLITGVVMSLICMVLAIMDKRIPVFIIALCTGFAELLMIIPNNKRVAPVYGMWVTFALIMAVGLFTFVILMLENKIDVRFMTRCLIAMFLVGGIVNVGLGTLWLSVMYGKAFMVYLPARLIKNAIQFPINAFIAYYMFLKLVPVKKYFID